MIEETSFRIEAILEGQLLTVHIVDIRGNAPEAITKTRIIGVLANALISAIRGREDDGDPTESELVRFAIDQISEGFVDTDASFYTPKN